MSEKVVNMIVLGPSRVGKTSLLATMYNEFGKLGVDFGFQAVGETADLLGETYRNLSAVMEQDRFTVVGDLLPGNEEFLEHRFDVSFQDTKEFQIAFHDYRGGTLMKMTDPDFLKLQQKVASSHVIFNVLDAVALMETEAPDSERLNAHNRVFELLSVVLKPGEKYLVVFVLVKCETYLKTPGKREALLDRFQDRHKAVLSLIRKWNDGGRNVAAVLVPVATLGNVEFHELVKEDAQSLPSFVFMRTQRAFSPRDVDQPLRYALSFALAHVYEARTIWNSLITRESVLAYVWRRLSGRHAAFGVALRAFCRDRNPTYRKYGNTELLEVR